MENSRYKPLGATFYSLHAATRMQQRCIPTFAVDLLLDYANPKPAIGGALCYRFDRKAWARVEKALGRDARHWEKYRNAYVIESQDGVIITVAWLQ